MCDFSDGFKPPEMVKKRPVIVISPRSRRTTGLCTVVAISTQTPNEIENHHVEIEQSHLPDTRFFQKHGNQCWVKCDMIYRVAFHRLDLIRIGKAKDRNYHLEPIDAALLQAITEGVLHSIGADHLIR
jgi:mRNA interferase MazF